MALKARLGFFCQQHPKVWWDGGSQRSRLHPPPGISCTGKSRFDPGRSLSRALRPSSSSSCERLHPRESPGCCKPKKRGSWAFPNDGPFGRASRVPAAPGRASSAPTTGQNRRRAGRGTWGWFWGPRKGKWGVQIAMGRLRPLAEPSLLGYLNGLFKGGKQQGLKKHH